MKRRSKNEQASRTKRRKSELTEEKIDELRDGIIESAKNYNDLVILIEALDKEGVQGQVIVSLVQVFGNLAKSGAMSEKTDAEKHNQVAKWLKERYSEYKAWLLNCIQNAEDEEESENESSSGSDDEEEDEESDKISGLCFSVLIKMMHIETEYLGRKSLSTFEQIVRALLLSRSQDTMFILLDFMKYDDIRYFFYQSLAKLCKELEQGKTMDKCRMASERAIELLLVSEDETGEAKIRFPKKNEDINEFYFKNSSSDKGLMTVAGHKLAFQNAWLNILRLSSHSENQYKTVLKVMHQKIIPHFQQPQLLLDFLTDCYDAGGSIALLALNGLFYLIQNHNLDYPHFYTKLYGLFDGSIMHATYRSRLFRLVDLFLSSTHLPVAVMASFIKKISRLALFAPPAAIVAIIPFIYNQLKRHPSCMVMIHRTESDQDGKEADPFDDREQDPLLTNALESSLWELDTLQSHYHPNVAALAKVMAQPFKKPNYALEDFLDHSYKTLTASEEKRRLKAAPALEYETFDKMMGGYMVGWTF